MSTPQRSARARQGNGARSHRPNVGGPPLERPASKTLARPKPVDKAPQSLAPRRAKDRSSQAHGRASTASRTSARQLGQRVLAAKCVRRQGLWKRCSQPRIATNPRLLLLWQMVHVVPVSEGSGGLTTMSRAFEGRPTATLPSLSSTAANCSGDSRSRACRQALHPHCGGCGRSWQHDEGTTREQWRQRYTAHVNRDAWYMQLALNRAQGQTGKWMGALPPPPPPPAAAASPGREENCFAGGGMARKPICPTPPSPSLVAVPGGGSGLGLPYLPCRGGGGPTPTYMPQNDPHVPLIILTTHMWRNIFS